MANGRGPGTSSGGGQMGGAPRALGASRATAERGRTCSRRMVRLWSAPLEQAVVMPQKGERGKGASHKDQSGRCFPQWPMTIF